MRIVICDDHQLLLEALATTLASQGLTVEAAVSTPADAVRAVEVHRPDVLIIDVHFPVGSGLDAAREVIAGHPGTKVVMMTGSEEPELFLEALAAGVSGYLRKDRSVDAIAAAIELAGRGGRPIDKGLMRQAKLPRPTRRPDSSPLADLTSREQHIAQLLGAGMSTQDMVRTLGVSQSTVRTHVQNIFTKLGVHSRLSAVALLAGASGFDVGKGHAVS